MAQTLVEQFKDIGVKINIKTLPNVQYWDWAIGALCI
jgi:ABC-type transport system substrate-binding protein